MNILKVATDWAKAELVSTSFFVIVGIVFVLVSIAFWQFGKTDLARAYIIPLLVTGAFLTIVGVGLFYTNKTRISQFEKAYKEDVSAFIDLELKRADATLKEYKTIVFTAIPIIILVCAVVLFLVSTPGWRASMISTTAMLAVILLIDGLAHARIAEYNENLLEAKEELAE